MSEDDGESVAIEKFKPQRNERHHQPLLCVVRFAHGNHFIHPSTDLRVLDIVKGKTHYELLFGLTLSFDNFERGKIYKKNPPSTTRGSGIFLSKG